MLLGEKLSERNGGVTLIDHFTDLGMREEALLGLTYPVELGVERRETRLLVIVLLCKSELRPEAQALSDEPFENEVVRKSETCRPVPAVQMLVPQRIRHRIIVHTFFRIVQIPVYASKGIIFSIIRVCIRILGKRDCRIGNIQPVDRKLVAELELACAVNKVHITFQRPSVRILHDSGHIAQAETDTIADLVLTAFRIDVMLVRESRTDRLAEPVCIHSPLDFLESLITETIQTDLGQRIAGIILINASQSLELELLARIHEVIVAEVSKRKAEVALI